MTPREHNSWLKEYLDAEFNGIKLQLKELLNYNKREEEERARRIKGCNERFTAIEAALSGANGDICSVKTKKKIIIPEGAGMWKKAGLKLIETFFTMWDKILTDITNSRIYRYSFILLILGIGFGAARKAGVFELGFIKEILAYILGLKVQ